MTGPSHKHLANIGTSLYFLAYSRNLCYFDRAFSSYLIPNNSQSVTFHTSIFYTFPVKKVSPNFIGHLPVKSTGRYYIIDWSEAKINPMPAPPALRPVTDQNSLGLPGKRSVGTPGRFSLPGQAGHFLLQSDVSALPALRVRVSARLCGSGL